MRRVFGRLQVFLLDGSVKPAFRQFSRSQDNFIPLKKVLLLQKLSRLEVEQFRNPELSENELKKAVIRRGTDYNAMLKHHDINQKFQLEVFKAFDQFSIETRVVNRFNYTESSIDWCDAVFPIGGDGTYLLAANKIQSNRKPIIGLNSDPCRSEGYLCLPKQFSHNIPLALTKLLDGKFRWMFRTRIRTTLQGGDVHDTPVELHGQALRFKISDIGAEEIRKPPPVAEDTPRVLPVLALNEVFIGESLSAKVSYFEVSVNGSKDETRVKSSGLLVCTGTGSTSWHLSVNRFNVEDVRQLLLINAKRTNLVLDEATVQQVCTEFNDSFVFSPEDSRLAYTIRDLISAGVWPKPKGRLPARGLVNAMKIKSRCSEGALVIDGGISFPFNDGTVALLETRPEDTLRTVIIDD